MQYIIAQVFVILLTVTNPVHFIFLTDEIICEQEMTNSLLAMNAICPGISTVAALLMHTFPYELVVLYSNCKHECQLNFLIGAEGTLTLTTSCMRNALLVKYIQ